MDHLTLENEKISIAVRSLGAELSSLFHKSKGTQYLWQGDPHYWSGQAPLLFPVVGGLRDDRYQYGNKTYTLPKHGFARRKKFEFQGGKSEQLSLLLRSDHETRSVYPFDFELWIKYSIEGYTLHAQASVINTSARDDMFFSFGFHPAFNVPLASQTRFEDYFLAFNKDNTAYSYRLKDALVSDESAVAFTEGRLELSHGLFENDALIFRGLQSDEIILQSRLTDRLLKFNFENYPYFGIWTKPGAPFLCLEPWHGIADHISHNSRLETKDGIMRLHAGNEWRCSFSVTIH
jgi:galactose mutarotase-like enzyme